jgi:hypothetical protein
MPATGGTEDAIEYRPWVALGVGMDYSESDGDDDTGYHR